MISMIRKSKLPPTGLDDAEKIPKLLTDMEQEKLLETEQDPKEKTIQEIMQKHFLAYSNWRPVLFNPFDSLTELEACIALLRYVVFLLQDDEKRAAFLKTDNSPFKKEPPPMTALLLCAQTINLAVKLHPISTLERPMLGVVKRRWHSDYLTLYNNLVDENKKLGPKMFSFWEIRMLKLIDFINKEGDLFDKSGTPDTAYQTEKKKTIWGLPELYFAAKYGHVGLAEDAILEGDNINQVHHELTPLDTAVRHAQKEIVSLLLSKPECIINVTPRLKKHSTLFYALQAYVADPTDIKREIIDLLIDHGAVFFDKDCIETLANNDLKVIYMDKFKNTPLHVAATFQLYKTVPLLLSVNAELDRKNEAGVSSREILEACDDIPENITELLSQRSLCRLL